MERWTVGLNNNSFDSAGITKDGQEAVCELIWNGFEAHANEINVILDGQEMVDPPVLLIEDNGSGIDHGTLKQTFGLVCSNAPGRPWLRHSEWQSGAGCRLFFTV